MFWKKGLTFFQPLEKIMVKPSRTILFLPNLLKIMYLQKKHNMLWFYLTGVHNLINFLSVLSEH